MRKKLAGGALVLATSLGVSPLVATATSTGPAPTSLTPAAQTVPTTLPVTGTLPDGTAFTGTISDLTATVTGRGQNRVLELVGTITGTGLPIDGTTFTAPIEGLFTDGPACTVLTLDLGPLHLDLLGLVIDLNEVELDITAVPGAGNLLGNLVCAVANLLNAGGPVGGLAALLNRLLTGLGL